MCQTAVHRSFAIADNLGEVSAKSQVVLGLSEKCQVLLIYIVHFKNSDLGLGFRFKQCALIMSVFCLLPPSTFCSETIRGCCLFSFPLFLSLCCILWLHAQFHPKNYASLISYLCNINFNLYIYCIYVFVCVWGRGEYVMYISFYFGWKIIRLAFWFLTSLRFKIVGSSTICCVSYLLCYWPIGDLPVTKACSSANINQG